jgi:hypothetical protein
MKHSRERKSKKKRQSGSNPYDGCRKIIVNGQIWHWSEGNSWYMNIYDPDGNRYNVSRRKVNGEEDYYQCGWSMPADVRRYIEEEILKIEPDFEVDPKAISGKLYAYREKSTYQGASITIEQIEGGAILENDSGNRREQWPYIKKYLNEQKPFMLLKAWIDKETKTAYYKILVQDIIATLKIQYPRTWSGSFIETTHEWQKENETRKSL